jgi:hypothetical protein
VARANGFQDAEVTYVGGLPANQFGVKITRQHPTFFGGLFGLGPRQLSATSIGQLTGGGGGAVIHASAPSVCGPVWGVGLVIGGDQVLTINGDVESNGQAQIGWLRTASYFPGGASQITGKLTTPCAPIPTNPSGYPITTQVNGSTGDPLSGVTLATLAPLCTGGTDMATALDLTPFWGAEVAGCNPLPSNVYCSSSDINVAPTGLGMSICPGTVATFVTPGRIMINANNAVNLQGRPEVPSRIIAFAGAVDASCLTQAINMGTAATFTLTGAVYAPNGCINIGGGNVGGLQLTGSLVGQHINIGMSNLGAAWVLNSAGGGGGGTGWRVYR